MIKKFGLVGFVLALLSDVAFADTIVLVQGYRGSPQSWRSTGITRVLVQSKWSDGGHFSARGNKVIKWQKTPKNVSKNRFYTVDLPTETPISFQSQFLGAYVEKILALHPGEKLHLVGHSAGGVVARASMVKYPSLKVTTLLTIAAPNRGTDAAETGLQVGNSPLSWFTPMMGAGTINRSQGLYRELVRERPNNYLGWLNRQKHPKARYVSVVRASGDGWVPVWSQDLNGVAALRGKAENYPVRGRHDLSAYDGFTILNLLGSK